MNKKKDLIEKAKMVMEKELQLFYILEDGGRDNDFDDSLFSTIYLFETMEFVKLFLKKFNESELANKKQRKMAKQIIQRNIIKDKEIALGTTTTVREVHDVLDSTYGYLEKVVTLIESFFKKHCPEFISDEYLAQMQKKAHKGAIDFIESSKNICVELEFKEKKNV